MLYIQLVMTAIFWGGTFVVAKIMAGQIGPYSASFLRFFVACIFLYFLAKKIEGKLPMPTALQFGMLSLLGLSGVFLYNVFFLIGMNYIGAGRASLIIALNPILICFSAIFLFKESRAFTKILGVVLAVCGALVVITNKQSIDSGGMVFGMGELMILGMSFSWVFYSLLGRVVMQSMSPIITTFYASLIGAAYLLVAAVFEGMLDDLSGYSFEAWAGVFYLGFFGTFLGYTWYYKGIQTIGASKASVFINLVPISAVLMGAVFLDEPVGMAQIFGASLVLSGVYLTSRVKEGRSAHA